MASYGPMDVVQCNEDIASEQESSGIETLLEDVGPDYAVDTDPSVDHDDDAPPSLLETMRHVAEAVENAREQLKTDATIAEATRAAKVQYLAGITREQKNLMENDGAYRKLIQEELLAEKETAMLKSKHKTLRARQELDALRMHGAVTLAEFSRQEELKRRADARSACIEEKKEIFFLEAQVDAMKVQLAEYVAEQERCESKIKRTEALISQLRALSAPS